ncbi:MAG: FAD-binding oxidoreductase [Promethearchaeota archaeon]
MILIDLCRKFEDIVGPDNLSTDEVVLYAYGADVGINEGLPDIVVRPSSTDEISRIVSICHQNKIPIIPRGAGTGATGGAVPISGGLVLDLKRMNKITDIDLENIQVSLQAGVIVDKLNETLKEHGFFFPVQPGSAAMATIGGVVANDASGMRAIKYGTAKDYVLAMTVVLPNGKVVKLGGKTLKNVAGYDLIRLFAGSEGTLGIIAELTLKIVPIPPFRGVLVAYFGDLKKIGSVVIKVYQAGIIPSAIEILDRTALEAIKTYKPDIDVQIAEAMLLFEVEGNKEYVEFQISKINAVLDDMNVKNKDFSTDPDRNEELWNARSLVGASTSTLRPGYNRVYEGEDICVPLAKIPEMLEKLREIKIKYELGCVIFGHISIGSLHPAITIRKSNKDDWENLKKMSREIHESAIKFGGTVTGEHGIGVSRKAYMELQNKDAYEIMKKIKIALDPDNIMNPGKIF